jgi:hypothetical protein
MKVEIKLSVDEAMKIIIDHFQPNFPDKVITGEISSYSGVTLDVVEKPKEGEPDKNEG